MVTHLLGSAPPYGEAQARDAMRPDVNCGTGRAGARGACAYLLVRSFGAAGNGVNEGT